MKSIYKINAGCKLLLYTTHSRQSREIAIFRAPVLWDGPDHCPCWALFSLLGCIPLAKRSLAELATILSAVVQTTLYQKLVNYLNTAGQTENYTKVEQLKKGKKSHVLNKAFLLIEYIFNICHKIQSPSMLFWTWTNSTNELGKNTSYLRWL